MKLRNNIILIFTLILIGCGEDGKGSKIQQESSEVVHTVDAPIGEVQIDKSEIEAKSNDSRIKIRFKEFIIELDSIEIWDEEGNLSEQHKDTTRIYLEFGETIEGQKLKVQKIMDGDIRIYQRFENSLTIMNEGPHCDLREWKHYNSDWNKLEIENGEFLTDSYSEKDREKFIEVDMTELKKAVRKQCGNEWAEYVKDIKSPIQYPCGVSVSRVFFKIEFVPQESEESTERIISFEIPMGC